MPHYDADNGSRSPHGGVLIGKVQGRHARGLVVHGKAAHGSIPYRSGAGARWLDPGTPGQVLETKGDDVKPAWVTLPAAGAPVGSSYLVIALDATLTAERKITAGAGINLTDAGANGDATLKAVSSPANSAILVGTGRQLFAGDALIGGGDLSQDRGLRVTSSPARSATVVGTGRSISTGAGLSGGGNLSANRTLVAVSSPSSSATLVGTGRSISTGAGLSGGGNLSANRTLVAVSSPSSSATLVGTGRTISTGTGLSGGGNLSANRTLRHARVFSGDLHTEYAKVKVGTYTGNGATSQAITGIGFAPVYVRIWTDQPGGTNVDIFETTTTIMAENANGQDVHMTPSTFEHHLNEISALGTDGFTVADAALDLHPNQNTQKYYYLAIG